MRITKLGHCCLLIEVKGKRILTDPGAYSTLQDEVKEIDIVLITHEHPDHIHIDSLVKVVANNPGLKVITNAAVGKILEREGIPYTKAGDGETVSEDGLSIQGYGTEHAYIHETVAAVENTGYFIDDRLFYPGDAFYDPKRPIDILALPVAGPWMKISDAIEYAKKLRPKKAFPVHDGMLVKGRLGPVHRLPESALKPFGIEFVAMTEGSVMEF